MIQHIVYVYIKLIVCIYFEAGFEILQVLHENSHVSGINILNGMVSALYIHKCFNAR